MKILKVLGRVLFEALIFSLVWFGIMLVIDEFWKFLEVWLDGGVQESYSDTIMLLLFTYPVALKIAVRFFDGGKN